MFTFSTTSVSKQIYTEENTQEFVAGSVYSSYFSYLQLPYLLISYLEF